MPVMDGYQTVGRIRAMDREDAKKNSDHSDDCQCVYRGPDQNKKSRDECTRFETAGFLSCGGNGAPSCTEKPEKASGMRKNIEWRMLKNGDKTENNDR